MASIRRVATMTAAAALALAGVLTVSTKPAEAVDPSAKFQKAFEANVNGAVIAIGNGLLTCPTTAGDPCTGQAQKGGKWDNNSFRMVYLDVDGDASTKTSSSSFLDLPDGAQVLFARLYWGARLTAGGSSPVYPGDQSLAHTMKFKLPGETAYRNVTGSLMALNSSQNGAYQASADVTAWVQALPGGPNGEYWGADVQAGTGLDRYAGWSMMVAYTAPGLPLRNLTVFEGFTTVNSLYQDSITVSGFLAPESGLVDAQLSMVAYEGDLAQTSDYTLLGTTQLATAVSPGSNFFDSVNSLNGDYVTTKNPAFQNMLGFDIKNLGVSGAIENGATDATFSFRTGGDVYYPGVVALAINLYAPDFTTSTKAGVNLTSSDGAWPGDTLQYTMTYNNTGQDPATNSVACDPIPAGSTYVPGSLTLVSAPSDYGLATPLALPDDGSSLGKYDISDPSKPQVCVNLGFGATSSAGGTIRVGDSTSYQFQVRIADTAGGSTVRNVAHLDYITATTKTPATYDTPPVATPVGLKADVSITKDMTPNPAIAGQAGRTTLRVTNLGPSQATGLTVTDPLPADYVATGATWSGAGGSGTCSTADGQVVCTGLPSLNLGQEIAIFINGSAKSDSLATTMSNTASVTTTSFDPVMSNNVATVSIPMTHQADLGITKTPTPQTVVPGKEIAWTLTVTNQCKPGSAPATNPEGCLSDATGVIISDTVADSSKLVLTGATGGAGTGGAEGDVKVTCPDSLTSPATFQCQVTSTDGLGRLKPKQTAVVKVTGYLMAHVATATENQAAVTSKTFDPVQSDNLTSATVTPGAAQSTIKLTKTGPASAVAGTRIDYTITAQNQGPSDAAGVVVTDTLPAQLSADSGTLVTSDRGSCAITTGAAPTVTCAVGALPGPGAPGGAGGIATIKITGVLLSASAAQGSTVTNSATVTCSSDCAQDPSDPPGVTTTVDTAADLAVAKTTTQPKLPAANSQVTYEITVTNNGPSDAVNVTLEDVLPEGMSLVSLTQDRSGSCLNASATCELASLPVGGVWNITVVGKVGATAYAPDATPTQTATVSSDTYDPDETDNQAKWVHRGEPQADLALTKSSSGFTAGEAGTYILKVTNNGPDAAADVTVVDTIPVGLTPDQSATNWPGVCQAQAEQQTQSWSVTCALTDLANGYSATVYIPVTADASLNNGAVLVNVAVAASTTADPTTSNNAAFTVDTVKALADVQVDFEILYPDPDAPADSPCTGASSTPFGGVYTGPGSVRCAQFKLSNTGPSTAKGVQIRSNVAVVSTADPSSLPNWCSVVNQELVCDLSKSESLPELPPGVTLTDIFPFTISSDTAAFSYPDCERDETCGVIGLIPPAGGWASVTTSTPETDLDNNYDTAGLVIAEAQTDLQISKVALTTIPNPNEPPGGAHPAYVAGEKFGYEIDLWVPARADGTSWADASGVALKDTVPNGFLITQANPGQGTCAIAGDSKSVSCDVGAVRASSDPSAPQKVSIYVYGTIGADVTAEISNDGGAVNTAEATSTTKDSAGDPTSVRAQAATDVIQQADLEVSKLADAAVSYAGAQVGYTITTINNGPSNSQNTVITDSLPLGLTLDLTNSPGCVVQTEATASAGQVIKCVPTIPGQTAGEIPANGSVNTRIVASTDPRDLRPYWCSLPATEGQTCPEVLPPADLNSEYPRALLNNVAVASSSNDTKPENNEAHVTTQLKALADVAISGAVSTDTPSAGSELTYTLAAFNNGPSSLDNPKVVVTLPPGFEVATDADGKYKVTGGYMDCTVTPGTSYTVTCVAWKATPTRDSLDPGFSVPGTITVNIPDDTPAGAYTAHAHTYSRSPVQCGADNPDEDPAVGTCESNYNNNQVDVTVNVVQSADTSLVKTLVEPDPIRLGQEVVYDLTVKNDGPSVADDVTISDVVPVGMTFVSGTVPGASCELADPSAPGDTGSTEEDPANPDDQAVVRCQAGSLAPGSTVKATLVFKVATNFAGDVCNSGLVGSGALDPKADNNQDKKCAGVAQPANTDLGVKVTADKGQVTPGQKATFRAVVTNNGPWDASGAAVTFTVPPGLSAATVTPISRSDGGTLDPCTASGQVFTCLIGDLAVGETAEYDVAGTAVGVAGDRLVVVADVTHNFADTDPSNDESQAEEAVISGVTPPGPTPTPSGSGSGGGSLSGTGSDSLGLAGWALAAVIVGAGLVALRLRRQGGQ